MQKNELTSSGRVWQEFIKNAGYLCDFSFDNIVNIYAQRPGCKYVDRYTEWNKRDRFVKRGSKGISIYDATRNYVTYVFAYEDTDGRYGNNNEVPWNINEHKLHQYFMNEFHISNSDNMFIEAAEGFVDKNKDVIYDRLSNYEIKYTDDIRDFIVDSLAVSLGYRLGYDFDLQFNKVKQLNSNELTVIGSIIVNATRTLLSRIKKFDIEKTQEFVYNKSVTIASNGRLERSDTYAESGDRISTSGGLSISEVRGGTTELARTDEVWIAEKRVFREGGSVTRGDIRGDVLATSDTNSGTGGGTSPEYNADKDRSSREEQRDNQRVETDGTINLGSNNGENGERDNSGSYSDADIYKLNDVEADETISSASFVTVFCEFSEHSELEGGKEYDIIEFNSLIRRLNHEWQVGRAQTIEKYGSLDNAMANHYYEYVGYAKTYFELRFFDGRVIKERMDIGDFDIDLVTFLSEYEAYKPYADMINSYIVTMEQARYENEVEQVIDGEFPFYSAVKVCDTPEILLDVGCEYLPILITQKHILNSISEDEHNPHKHGLSIEQIKKLPEFINEPVIIFDSISRDDSIVLVTDDIDKNDNPIIVSIRPNGKGRYELEELDSNFITSVYGKDNLVNYIQRVAEKGKILFIDKLKSQDMFKRWGLQLPELINNLDFDIIIHKSDNIVNMSEQKNNTVIETVVNQKPDGAEDRGDKYKSVSFEQMSLFDFAISESEQIGNIISNNVEKNEFINALVSDELVEKVLIAAPWETKYLIYDRVIRPFDTEEKMIEFVKDKYLNTYVGFISVNGDKIAVCADETGIKIAHGKTAKHKYERLISYDEAYGLITNLITEGKYVDAMQAVYAEEHSLKLLIEHIAYSFWDTEKRKYVPEFLEKYKGIFPDFYKNIKECVLENGDNLKILCKALHEVKVRKDWSDIFKEIELLSTEPTPHKLFENIDSPSEYFITDDFIHSRIRRSGFAQGEYRIYKYFSEDYSVNKSMSEATKFLIKEYGIGGGSCSSYSTWSDAKGYKIEQRDMLQNISIKLKWTDIAKHLIYLVENNYFFNKDGLEKYMEWKAEREIKSLETENNILYEAENKKEEINAISVQKGTNYKIDVANTIRRDSFAPRSRFRDNIEAITLLNKLENENRQATPEEQHILAKYVGWGGLQDAFDVTNEKWASEYNELKNILSEEEYVAARQSVLTAFYTAPEVISAMYAALDNMGFSKGRILEPSCGIGNFFGCIPENYDVSMHGVELDSISGRIAKMLYPNADIQITGYEKACLNDNYFDVAIGNVPFGAFKVYDPEEKKWNFSIHNYFFAKTIKKVKSGGVIAFITSSATMDAKDSSFRKYVVERAEFLGAIRLPTTAFKGIAGTEVVSDIIFLKKRAVPTVDIEDDKFVYVGNHEGHNLNEYFIENPHMICGTLKEVSGPYGPELSCVLSDSSLGQRLEQAITGLRKYTIDTTMEINEVVEVNKQLPASPDIDNLTYGIIDGKIYYRNNSFMTRVTELTETNYKKLYSLVEMKDTLKELISLQLLIPNDDIELQITNTRTELNKLYDAFYVKYGYINSKNNSKILSSDNDKYKLFALENPVEDNKYVKSDIFMKRTVKPVLEVKSSDSAEDALAVSLSQKGYVDISYISSLTDISEEECIEKLGDLIYKDCFSGEYVTADEYLSGNVGEKLNLARIMSEDDISYQKNVLALEKCIPEKIEAKDISVRLGSGWIPLEIYEEFIFELLETPNYYKREIKLVHIKETGEYIITHKTADKKRIQVISTYGIDRKNAYEIIEDTLNLRDTRITDEIELADGRTKRVLNKEKTIEAQSKQDIIKQKFEEWIWKEPERVEKLEKLYNQTFNNIRNREYNGSFLTLPGSNPSIKLKDHQLNAVARIVYGGNTLLAHVVGAGKTFEMIAAAMESKRLGLCNKPLFVVPNHLTMQWANEFMKLYPTANILVASKKDFTPEERKKFCTRIAMGEYDAVIIGHSQFEKIPMSKEYQETSIRAQIDSILAEISSVTNGVRYGLSDEQKITVKRLEKTKRSLEVRLAKLNDDSKKDHVITFEELGVDRLYVDEAHYYKNLYTYTKMRNVAGIPTTESQKSFDMLMKCEYINKLTNEKGIVFATGTPISNSMVEMYTLQRYLAPTALKERGLTSFDSWASTFGDTVTAMELAPEGTGYRLKTRFSKFYNLPELVSMFKEFADVKTSDMLDLDVPVAEYHNITIQANEFQKTMLNVLADRAEQVRAGSVDPSEDNMLKITTDGRKLALDQRIINPMLDEGEESKAKCLLNKAMKLYRQYNDDKALQLIFSDMSTPTTGKGDNTSGFTNIYDDIKSKLIAEGVPESEIAFIHDANTELQKDELFAKCRSGAVRFLLGSTSKLGAGTNVQNRLIALHHLDVPWRPSDIEQQEGRIIRQGNMYKKVNIFRYVTEGTFDAYSWQIIENKQKFIGQIMTSKSPVRVADDVDEAALSYAEVKALASGNPYIKERMEIEQRLSKLKMMKASYNSEHLNLKKKIDFSIPEELTSKRVLLASLKADYERIKDAIDVKGFPGIILGKKTYTDDMEKAGEHLISICMSNKEPGVEFTIGEYRGFKLTCTYNAYKLFDIGETPYELKLVGECKHSVELGRSSTGNFIRLENALRKLPEKIDNVSKLIEMLENDLVKAKEEYSKPFAQEAEYEEKTKRLKELDELLDIDKDKEEQEEKVQKKKTVVI